MIIQQFIVINLVDAVTACNDDVRLMAALQPFKILVHSVCRTTIPPAVVCCDRRGEYKQTALLSTKIPPFEELRCSFSERALYCDSTATFCTWELLILLNAKSMQRKLPATGIAAIALLRDNASILELLPPAKIIPNAFMPSHLPL